MLLKEFSVAINPLTSFLKILAISSPTPPIPKLNLLTESYTSSNFDPPSYKDLDVLMHEETMHNPTVEEPPEPTNTPSPPYKNYPSNSIDVKTFFPFDDIPPSQWREKMLQMYAWLEVELQVHEAQLKMTLAKFTARLNGKLREWWLGLGEYHQLQALQSESINGFMSLIHI